jgi:hypothetical protein
VRAIRGSSSWARESCFNLWHRIYPVLDVEGRARARPLHVPLQNLR